MSISSSNEPHVAIDVSPADEIKTSTCYMCACRCGIKVYLKNGKVRYIEGNRDHPVNKGVLCGKGSAGIMQHYSPARLKAPLKRVGERGSGEYVEISWDEALETAAKWLGDVRKTDPKKLAFFTGRDQSQSLTGWWAQQFGTLNFAAHGGFCSVNMAAGGLYTFGGAFWEFGDPDWERTKYFMLFGVAEDHASNPIKMGLGKLKERGVKVVTVNPVRTGYQAIADEWIGLKPGTDGVFIGALIHELLRTEQVDLPFLVRYTNAPWLVIRDPGAADDGLFARDANGKPLCFDKTKGALADATGVDVTPALTGSYTLADGRTAVPSFQILAERYLSAEYSPERAEKESGIPAATTRRIAQELADVAFKQEVVLDVPWTDWAGRRHEKMIGRPISMHAMRGISAHSNGFHTARLLHFVQILLGSIDCPGGFRYKPPYPRPTPPPLKPAGKAGTVKPMTPLTGPPLGFPMGPEDLLVDAEGNPERIDKAYSWDAPLAAHGLMHMVITNAALGDPYPVDVLFMYMANMSWNSTMNVPAVLKYLTDKDPKTGDYKIPKIIYSDSYFSEMVPYADLILPDTTYLERWDCISLLDRPVSEPDAAADSIRQPVVQPDRDVRGFQTVLIDLGARLKLPGFVNDDGQPKYPGGYADYIVNHERAPGLGPLAGFRGKDGKSYGKGEVNPRQLDQYIANGCFYAHHLKPEQRYFKHANKDYLEWAKSVGFIGSSDPIIFQLYLEPMQKFRLAARGHGAVKPPESHRKRIEAFFDPLPFWYKPFEGSLVDEAKFPFYAVTQRPMHMYHSWGSQNAWLRQITAANRLYMHYELARQLGVKDDGWVWVKSEIGRVRCQVRLMDGVNEKTVWTWNAIGKRSGAWNLADDAPEATQGFLLNHLISELLPERAGGYRFSNSDPVTGQAAWYDLRVAIEPARPDEAHETSPRFERLVNPSGRVLPDVSMFGASFREAGK
ncbi:MAG: molybdopterin oxidoreductase family protein [Hyphomicrobiaceae bacterium]|nr:molybdopterin oxidoreductase family protein [Hyphomicrobiaceae bacterium]